MFTNRIEAGKLLAKKLKIYKNRQDVVIVTIPRGGIPVGNVLSRKLNAPLEIILSKKIGHPFNKEYAIGAVTLNSRVLNDTAAKVSDTYIESETERIKALLKQRYKWYYGNNSPISLKNKVVILVDDGIATGNTLLSSARLIQQQDPSEIIVAIPVAAASSLKKIKKLAFVTKIICLLIPKYFMAVGQFYEEFNQVTDEEVIQLLKEANNNFKYYALRK